MPPIKYDKVNLQINTLPYWENVFSIIDKDDPLKKQFNDYIDQRQNLIQMGLGFSDEEFPVKGNDGKTYYMTSADMLENLDGILEDRMINFDDPVFKEHMEKGKELLKKVEEKYCVRPESEFLKNRIELIRTNENAAMQGIGFNKSPGEELFKGFDGVQKFQDVQLQSIRTGPDERKINGDRMQYVYPDPAEASKAMKDLGVLDIDEDFLAMNKHCVDWQKEWDSPNRDPKKLRKHVETLEKDFDSLEKHIHVFEQNFYEDAKLPKEQRKVLKFTKESDVEKNDLIQDYSKGVPADTRAINSPTHRNRRDIFKKQAEKFLLHADLEDLKKKQKNIPSKLKEKMNSLSENCLADYNFDYRGKSGEEAQERQRIVDAFTYEAMINQLQELDKAAKQYPDNPAAQEVAKVTSAHLSDPVVLKMMEANEMKRAEKKINEDDLSRETDYIEDIQDEIKGISVKENECPKDKTPEKFFEEQKEALSEQLAELLAVKTLARSVKSRVLFDDSLNAVDKAELISDMLNADTVKAAAEDIKTRDDFKHMMRTINGWDRLSSMKANALEGNGGKVFDELSRKRLLSARSRRKILSSVRWVNKLSEILDKCESEKNTRFPGLRLWEMHKSKG